MIKVLIVDDSAFMRMVIRNMLVNEKDIKVVGIARNGKDALNKVRTLKPDVVTMDVTMPVMDGIEATRQIMQSFPVPIIMVSALSKQSTDATLRALEAGAVDYIQKDKLDSKLLVNKIRCAASANLESTSKPDCFEYAKQQPGKKGFELAAIGISTGGPGALISIIPKINKDIKGSILIAQHMPPVFTNSLAERLNGLSKVKVVEAHHNMQIQQGTVYIAPGGKQMTVSDDKTIIITPNDETKYRYAPSVDLLMASVSNVYRKHAVCIIMTGMGSDGKQGIIQAKKNNSHVIAQSPESCVIYGMPKAIIEQGLQDEVVHLDSMADRINQLLG